MNEKAQARSSRLSRRQQDFPVLRASTLGDEAFIGFVRMQAVLPSGAPQVVSALKERVKAGYRLDRMLSDILRQAESTVKASRRILA